MTRPLFGELSAYPQSSQAQADLATLINDRVQPPAPLRLEDIHIRAMRLISDQVNDHGGRFPVEEHQRLCELLIDSPVMIGHDHSQLPVARNFAARCVDEGERSWVEVWFYWMHGEGPHHDQLAADIDAGVVKEGSIGFEFALPQCSICREDIRTCEHIPGFEYDGTTAHYEYRNIMRVLETSLVYRGATPNTRIVKYPLFSKLSARTVEGDRTREPALGAASKHSDPPALLRAFPTAGPALRSFHYPTRQVPWPRDVCEYKAGHGPLTLRVRKRIKR